MNIKTHEMVVWYHKAKRKSREMLKSTVILTLLLGCYEITAQSSCDSYEDDYKGDLCKFDLYSMGSINPVRLETCADIEEKIEKDTNTVILVNGEGSAVEFLSKIRHEIHVNLQEPVNIISVDWRGTSNGYTVSKIGEAGQCLTEFIRSMMQADRADFKNIHIVGFSLGAHVAGIAGRRVATEEKVARITGLDPARIKESDIILAKTDASYVEVIHTDAGPFGYGIYEPMGHTDFYANNGKSQPGCSNHICCHNRAHQLFASSMTDGLKGQECTSKAQIDLNLCKGRWESFGNIAAAKKCLEDSEGCREAWFRINTKRNPPYY